MPETNKRLPKILIRADATREIALGHLKRCISLGYKLKEKGIYVTFLSVKDHYAQELLAASDFPSVTFDSTVNSKEDFDKTIETAKQLNTDIVIIDSYEIDNQYREGLMDQGLFVVSISDISYMEIVSHMIVNGNLNAEKIRYNVSDKVMAMLLGIKYLILGRDFWHIDNTADGLEKVKNILITMGGIDHYDLTTKILMLLDNFKLDFNITVIAGPYYENMANIESQIKRVGKKVSLIKSPCGLYDNIKNCSLAFSAGGQTLYELAILGRPTIGIMLWDNQAGNVNELAGMGAIKGVVYSDEKRFKDTLTEYAMELINDISERKRISRIASSIVDGKGPERISNAMLGAYNKWSTKKVAI